MVMKVRIVVTSGTINKKMHKEIFWAAGNVLYLSLDGGYMGELHL